MGDAFGHDADPRVRDEAIDKIMTAYEYSQANSRTPHTKFNSLMTAVTATLDGMENEARKSKGWCDTNDWVLAIAMEARTKASRNYAIHKTPLHLQLTMVP